jgi:tetratricopeptide (TPR) repeat protein
MTASEPNPSIPDYLLAGPEGDLPAPPVQPREAELPFGQLSWPNFERLCYRLAQRISTVEHVQIYGTPGQDQDGIDVFARLGDDYHVFQCRRTKTMPPNQIKAAVDDFVKSDWSKSANTFVLCTTDSLRSTQRAAEVERQAARLGANGQAFVLWDLEHLSDELRDKGELVDEFFGPVWRERFCISAPKAFQARLSNIRHPTATFSFREPLLGEISAVLAGEAQSRRRVALHGIGGAGKTQVAAAWAVNHAADFEVAWWIAASEDGNIDEGLRELGEELGVVQAGMEHAAAIRVVTDYLASVGRWLIVLDDLDGPHKGIDTIPTSESGALLVTSRHHGGWRAAGMTPVAVPVWTADEASMFLQERTDSDDAATARAIAEALGGLPLAVAQASSYIDEAAISLHDYLVRLREAAPELLKRGRAAETEETVRTTWLLAVETVEKRPDAMAMLAAAAFMAPVPIPNALLASLPDLAGKSPEELVDARTALFRVSLAEPSEDGLVVHPLVQMVTRERLAESGAAGSWSSAVHAVEAVLEDRADDPETWVMARRVVPHVHAVAEQGDASSSIDDAIYLLVVVARAAAFYTFTGNFREGLRLYERAVSISSVIAHGGKTIDHAHLLNDFGIALYRAYEDDQAALVLEEALEIKRRLLGDDSPELASTWMNLGNIASRRNDLAEARGHYQQALQAATTGGDQRVRAMALMLLGIIELKAGAPSEAVARHKEALRIVEQLTPVPDAEIARIRGNLGNALLDLGEAGAALAEQEAALAIKERIYPAPHWELADTIGNLGNAQRLSGDTASAISSYERQLSMEEALYGAAHPALDTCLTNLSDALNEAGDPKRAAAIRSRRSDSGIGPSA